MLKKWVGAGLEFGCTGCGDCCRRPGYVYVKPAEAAAMVAHRFGAGAVPEHYLGQLWRRDHEGTFVIDVRPGGGCTFLDGNKCTVHEVKPIQCRTYPFWPEVLESKAAWAAESLECEGIARGGVVVPASEIRRILGLAE